MYHLHQLVAQADGVALGDEDDTVEGVGDDEDREGVGVRQLHGGGDLLLDCFVGVDAVCDGAGQVAELFRVEVLEAFLVREE